MRRRQFITLLGGAAAAWPVAARAQTNRVRKIGVLLGGSENDAEMRAEVFALQKGLQELGWTEGRNVHFEFRWPNGDPDSADQRSPQRVNSFFTRSKLLPVRLR